MAEIKKYLDQAALGALVDQIKSADAKTLAAAKSHADGLASNYDAAGAAATAESNAKAYTDALANGQVKTNKEAIATLNGDVNTAGSVAKSIADAKAVIDADIDAVDGKADKNAQDIAAINNADTGILKQSKDYADGKAAEVQGNVDTLSNYVGTIPATSEAANIVAYVQEKTSGIATDTAMEELTGRVAQAEADIDNIEKDYLKAADKAELNGLIEAAQTAVATEKSRAEGIEAGLRTDVDGIKADYLTSTDKTALENSIKSNTDAIALLTNGVDAETVDGVNDLIAYVAEHGTEVTGMKEDIAQNASDISGVAGRMTTAEGKITAVEGAVATKAEKTYVDEKVEDLQDADTGLGNRITVLEGKFGGAEGSIEDQIADAQAAAEATAAADATEKANAAEAAAKGYADAEIDKVEATIATLTETVGTKAAQSDLNTLAGRVTTAEGEIDTLQGEMDAVEAKAAANESAISALQTAVNGKVAQGDFDDAVARIAQNETDIAALEEASETHALASDLNNAVARIAQNETDIAANASAINSFTAITADEVNALFA